MQDVVVMGLDDHRRPVPDCQEMRRLAEMIGALYPVNIMFLRYLEDNFGKLRFTDIMHGLDSINDAMLEQGLRRSFLTMTRYDHRKASGLPQRFCHVENIAPDS